MATPTPTRPTATLVLPLTTTFTPAPSCLSEYHKYFTTTSNPAITPFFIELGSAPSSCLPSSWASTSQFFSPGICPQGYTIACSSLLTISSLTETRATCCPTAQHFTCQTSQELTSDWIQTVYRQHGCTIDGSDVGSYTVTFVNATANGGEGVTEISPTSKAGVNAWGISVRFLGADLVMATATSTSLGTPGATHRGQVGGPKQASSLGVGAIIGIAVPIALAAIAFSIWLFFCCRKRKRRNQSEEGLELPTVENKPTRLEYTPEMDGSPFSEIGTSDHGIPLVKKEKVWQSPRLGGRDEIHELHGS